MLVERYEEMLNSGKSIYFDAGEFDDLAEYYDAIEATSIAESVVDKGLRIHPSNQQLLLKKAKFIMHKGQYNETLDFLNSHFTGYDLDFYLLKIECLLYLDLYAEAVELTTEAINEETNEEEILYSELGFIYTENDHFDEGINFFQKSLSINANNEEVLTELSYAYEMKNDFDSAIVTCNKLLDINPYSHDIWISLGKLYSLQEKYENAIDAFEFAATIDDCDSDILRLKAHCLSLCGRVEEAIDIFEEQINENPEDPSVYNSLIDCYFSIAEYNKMLFCIDQYEKLNGENIETIAKKAIAFLQKDDFDNTLHYIEKGLGLDAENADINIVAGEYYFQLDNYFLAESFFLNVYNQGNKKNGTLLDKLALINIAQGNIDNAIKYTEELIEITEEDTQIRLRLALLYFETGDKKRFLDYISSLNDGELRHLVSLFFSGEESTLLDMNKEQLINRMSEARECRVLYKNLKY